MSFDPNEFDRSYAPAGQVESLGQYTAKTFLWMCLGLLVTFAVSISLYSSGMVYVIFGMPNIQFVLLIAEVLLVIVLSACLRNMSVLVARAMFLTYAVVNGVVFSTLFFAYYLESMVLIFGMTALYFGALAAYGYLTKTDLSRLRPILLFGAVFLLLFWVLSMFINLTALEQIVSLIGMGIFMAFTAYDTQKIKAFYNYYSGYPDMLEKASIFSALELYLDFVNLFLYLLRFLGNKKR